MKCIAVLFLFAGLSLALPVGKQTSKAEAQQNWLSRPITLPVLMRMLAGGDQAKTESTNQNRFPIDFPIRPSPTFPEIFENANFQEKLAQAQLDPVGLAILGGVVSGLTGAGTGFGLSRIPLKEAQDQEIAKAQLGPVGLAILGGAVGGLTGAGAGFGLSRIPLKKAQMQEELAKAQLDPITLAIIGGIVSGGVGAGVGFGLNRIPQNQKLAQKESFPDIVDDADFRVFLDNVLQKLQDSDLQELLKNLINNDDVDDTQIRDQSLAKLQKLSGIRNFVGKAGGFLRDNVLPIVKEIVREDLLPIAREEIGNKVRESIG